MAHNYRITVEADTSRLEKQIEKALGAFKGKSLDGFDLNTQNMLSSFQSMLKTLQSDLDTLKVDNINIQTININPIEDLHTKLNAINGVIKEINGKEISISISSEFTNNINTVKSDLERIIELKSNLESGRRKDNKAAGLADEYIKEAKAYDALQKQIYSNKETTTGFGVSKLEKEFNSAVGGLNVLIDKYEELKQKGADTTALAEGMTAVLKSGEQVSNLFSEISQTSDSFTKKAFSGMQEAANTAAKTISQYGKEALQLSVDLENSFKSSTGMDIDQVAKDIPNLNGRRTSIKVPVTLNIDEDNITGKVQSVVNKAVATVRNQNIELPIKVKQIKVTTNIKQAISEVKKQLATVREEFAGADKIVLPDVDPKSMENFQQVVEQAKQYANEIKDTYASVLAVINQVAEAVYADANGVPSKNADSGKGGTNKQKTTGSKKKEETTTPIEKVDSKSLKDAVAGARELQNALNGADQSTNELKGDTQQLVSSLSELKKGLGLTTIQASLSRIKNIMEGLFKPFKEDGQSAIEMINNLVQALGNLSTEKANALGSESQQASLWDALQKDFQSITPKNQIKLNSKTKKASNSFANNYTQYKKIGGEKYLEDLTYADGSKISANDLQTLYSSIDLSNVRAQAEVVGGSLQKVGVDAKQLKQVLNDTFKDINLEQFSTDISNISTVLTSAFTTMDESGQKVPSTIQQIVDALSQLNQQLNLLFQKGSDTQLSSLWSNIEKDFKTLTPKGRVNRQGAARQQAQADLVEQYQQYLKLGGTNRLEDLTYANKKKINKQDLKKLYSAVNEADINGSKLQQEVFNNIVSLAQNVQSSIRGNTDASNEWLLTLEQVRRTFEEITKLNAKDILDSTKKKEESVDVLKTDSEAKIDQAIKDISSKTNLKTLETKIDIPTDTTSKSFSSAVEEAVLTAIKNAYVGTFDNIDEMLKKGNIDFDLLKNVSEYDQKMQDGGIERKSSISHKFSGAADNIFGNRVYFGGKINNEGLISVYASEEIAKLNDLTEAEKQAAQAAKDREIAQKSINSSLADLDRQRQQALDLSFAEGKTDAYYNKITDIIQNIESLRQELLGLSNLKIIDESQLTNIDTHVRSIKNNLSDLKSSEYDASSLLPNTQDVTDLLEFTKSDSFLKDGTLKLETLKQTLDVDGNIISITGQIESANGSLITFTNSWDKLKQGVRSVTSEISSEAIVAKQAIKDQQQAQKALEKDQAAAAKKVGTADEFFKSGRFSEMSKATGKTSDYYTRMQQLQQQYNDAYTKYQTLQGKDVNLFDQSDIQTASELSAEIAKIAKEMSELSGKQFNLNSNPAYKQTEKAFKALDKIDEMNKVKDKTDVYYEKLNAYRAEIESLQGKILPLQKSNLSDQEVVQLKEYTEALDDYNKKITALANNKDYDAKNRLGELIPETKDIKDLRSYTEKWAGERGKLLGDLRETANGYTGKIQLPTGEIVQFSTALDQAGQGVRMLSHNVGSSQSGLQRMGQAFGSIAQGMLRFAGLQRVIGAVFRELREGFQFAQQMDQSLTTVSMTMDVTKSGLRELGASAIDMAQDLSTTVDSVTSVAEIYANMNESVSSIMQKTRPTLMLSNASGLDVSTASDIIQGVSQQYTDLDGQEQHIVDSLETVSASMKMNFGSGIQAMSQAIEKSGSVAQEAGLSYEKLIALAGKVTEITRQSGDMTGNALKTIFARIGRVNDPDEEALSASEVSNIAKAYKSVGISVYDANGNFQDIDITLSALADKWDTLTDAQRSYIAEQSAGRKVA